MVCETEPTRLAAKPLRVCCLPLIAIFSDIRGTQDRRIGNGIHEQWHRPESVAALRPVLSPSTQ
jgi:hypothetical protein